MESWDDITAQKSQQVWQLKVSISQDESHKKVSAPNKKKNKIVKYTH